MFGSFYPRAFSSKASASRRSNRLGLSVAVALASLLMLVLAGSAAAQQAPVSLGTADSFAVLAGQSVTNTGPSLITGDLGVSPGTAISGFPPGLVLGTQHSADAVALQAQTDLTAAYNVAAGRGPAAALPPDAGGLTLVPGAYNAPSTLGLTGTLTLDAQGDPNAVWIFQVGSGLTTASASSVLLVNGASPCNVYWQVGSSATLGTNSTFVGNLLALTSTAAQTGATVDGRLLARNGSVTLDTNTVTRPGCTTPEPPGTPPGTGTSPGRTPDTGSGASPTSGTGSGPDRTGPRVRITRVPRVIKRSFTARVRVRDRSGIRRVRVYVDGKLVKRTSRKRFPVRVRTRGLRIGRHRITVVARDRVGNRSVTTRRFGRRALRGPAPRFTG